MWLGMKQDTLEQGLTRARNARRIAVPELEAG